MAPYLSLLRGRQSFKPTFDEPPTPAAAGPSSIAAPTTPDLPSRFAISPLPSSKTTERRYSMISEGQSSIMLGEMAGQEWDMLNDQEAPSFELAFEGDSMMSVVEPRRSSIKGKEREILDLPPMDEAETAMETEVTQTTMEPVIPVLHKHKPRTSIALHPLPRAADSASTSTSTLPNLSPPVQLATIQAAIAVAPVTLPKYLLPKNHPAHPRKSMALPPPILAKVPEALTNPRSRGTSKVRQSTSNTEKTRVIPERVQILAPPPFSPILPPMLASPASNPDDMFRRRSRDSFPPRLDELYLPHSDEILRMTSTPRVEGTRRVRDFRMGRSEEIEMEVIEEISSEVEVQESSDKVKIEDDLKDMGETEAQPQAQVQTLATAASIRPSKVAHPAPYISAKSVATITTTKVPVLAKASRRASRVPNILVPPPLARAFLKKSQPSVLTTTDRPNPTLTTSTTTSVASLPTLFKSSRRASRVPNPLASPPRVRAFLKKSQPVAIVPTLLVKPYSRPPLAALRVPVEEVDPRKTTNRLMASGVKMKPAGRLSVSGPSRFIPDLPLPLKVAPICEAINRPTSAVPVEDHTISDQPRSKVKAKSSAISLTLPTDFEFTSNEREEERRAKIRVRMEEREIREEERKARDAKESKKRASAWALAVDPVAKRARVTPEPVLPSAIHPPRTLASQISSNRRRSQLASSNLSNISTSSSINLRSSLTKEALETNSRLVSGDSRGLVRGMSLEMVGRYLEGVIEERDEEEEEMEVEKVSVPTVAIRKQVPAPVPRQPLGTSKAQNLPSTLYPTLALKSKTFLPPIRPAPTTTKPSSFNFSARVRQLVPPSLPIPPPFLAQLNQRASQKENTSSTALRQAEILREEEKRRAKEREVMEKERGVREREKLAGLRGRLSGVGRN